MPLKALVDRSDVFRLALTINRERVVTSAASDSNAAIVSAEDAIFSGSADEMASFMFENTVRTFFRYAYTDSAWFSPCFPRSLLDRNPSRLRIPSVSDSALARMA